jgi:hypothetical protein
MTVLNKYNNQDVIQIQLLGELNGRRNMNTFNFMSKRNNLFVSDIGDDINYLCFLLKNICSNTQRWTMWKHRRVVPHPITEYGEVSLFVSPGVGTGPAAHPALCSLFRITTEIDKPWARGRFYVPGQPRDYWDGVQYTFAARQNLQNTMSAMFDQWKAMSGFSGNMMLGVNSRGDHDTTFLPMIGMDWGPFPAIQRRRGYY